MAERVWNSVDENGRLLGDHGHLMVMQPCFAESLAIPPGLSICPALATQLVVTFCFLSLRI
jgi:hypothetical protein